MKNNFMNNINSSREAIEAKKAEELAKKIKQYCGIDTYHQFKEGKLFPIIIDDIFCGVASTKEEADKGIEYLSHFTGGKALNKETLFVAGANMAKQTKKGYDIFESKVNIKEALVINSKEYVIDDSNELYTINGEHITNVADIIDKKETIGDELFTEILSLRINKYEKEYHDDDDYDYDDEYDDSYDDDCE